ncbi:MAG: extracellular solute-binding protein [Clostridia bacterium]
MEAKYGDTYPIQTDETLTYWMPMTANISTSAANYGELPVAQELTKRTGIKVEYIHPSLTNTEEKFNLMVASGELADIIEYSWGYYGPSKAIKDGIIVPLNDLIDAYAPNLKKILEDNPNIAREAKTDAGEYFTAGIIAIEDKLNTSGGLIIRQDWLDDLGLAMPETIPEWYEVLKAFKEKKGATAPLSVDASAAGNGAFVGAFQTTYNFYLKDGKVVYGPMEPGFKEYLKTMNQWYNEGLFDNNFSTTDGQTRNANMLNGVSGVIYGGLGGSMGALINASQNPNFKLSGAPYPTHAKGEKPMFGQTNPKFSVNAAISTKCKSPELAMRFLDYGYSEEGSLFMNFGTEGVSYEMKDGYPTYTEEITKNPSGLTMAQALTKYCKAGQNGPQRQDLRYLEQYAGRPEQQQAWENWYNTDARKYVLPTTYIAEDKAKAYATKFTDVTSYVNEMYIKFISGIEPIDNFDTTYMESLKKRGIEDLIAMRQEAYENYQKR